VIEQGRWLHGSHRLTTAPEPHPLSRRPRRACCAASS
jgi:hypothetical protein